MHSHRAWWQSIDASYTAPRFTSPLTAATTAAAAAAADSDLMGASTCVCVYVCRRGGKQNKLLPLPQMIHMITICTNDACKRQKSAAGERNMTPRRGFWTLQLIPNPSSGSTSPGRQLRSPQACKWSTLFHLTIIQQRNSWPYSSFKNQLMIITPGGNGRLR